MDFLKAGLKELHLDDNKHSNNTSNTAPAQPGHGAEKGLFDTLQNAIKDVSSSSPPKHNNSAPAPTAQTQKHGGLLGKLTDVINDASAPTPPPSALPASSAKKDESFFDKLGDKITGHKTPPPPPPPQGLFDKIESVITGKTNAPPPKASGIGGKINEVLGGGSKGEAKEGKLDKAIDLFQEHVLKEGPQHHESALEQAKDKQIADTIRKTVGLPDKK